MTHPKERVEGVYLAMEVDVRGLLEPHSPAWDFFADKNFLVDLSGKTDEFLKQLGSMAELGVPQEVISLFKYARDCGARWLKLNL